MKHCNNTHNNNRNVKDINSVNSFSVYLNIKKYIKICKMHYFTSAILSDNC